MDNIKSLFQLNPEIIFLNHGSFGATPRSVFEVYQSWLARLENQPVLFLGRELPELLFAARKKLGLYLNACAEDLVFIPNSTYGVNIAARSLTLGPGDQILTSDHEYGACDYCWEFVCSKTGATYVHQPISLPVLSDELILDEFWKGVNPQTKAVYLSMITSPTALRMPVEKICERARSNGILSIIDAAHAPGQEQVDLQLLGADIVFGNCHKWMLAPKGSAFLFVRPEVQKIIEPLVVSWGFKTTPKTTSGSSFIDLLQWTGTNDHCAYLSVPSAIEFMQDNHWDSVRVECNRMLRIAIDEICSKFDLKPLYPLDSHFFGQMAIAPLPEVNLDELKNRLYTEYNVEVPLIQWHDKQFVRISVQGYNTRSDVEVLISGLTELIPQLKI
jgi:isopenicillin-N epimerase